jgi:hypothetical protein
MVPDAVQVCAAPLSAPLTHLCGAPLIMNPALHVIGHCWFASRIPFAQLGPKTAFVGAEMVQLEIVHTWPPESTPAAQDHCVPTSVYPVWQVKLQLVPDAMVPYPHVPSAPFRGAVMPLQLFGTQLAVRVKLPAGEQKVEPERV